VIEAEPVAHITAHKVQHFVWKNIVCRFGVPRRLVSDNGTQFASQQLGKLVYRGGHQASVRICRTRPDEWTGGVCQQNLAEGV